jgi:hypothetical protein
VLAGKAKDWYASNRGNERNRRNDSNGRESSNSEDAENNASNSKYEASNKDGRNKQQQEISARALTIAGSTAAEITGTSRT